MDNNVIQAGRSESSTFMAFGDDSQFNGALVYGFAVLKRGKLKSIIREMKAIKERFGIPDSVGIHCRNLRSGQYREKNNLTHIGPAEVEQVLRNVVTVINTYNVLVRYAFAFEEKVKAAFEGPLAMEGAAGREPSTIESRYDAKGVLGILANACFNNEPSAGQGPHFTDCDIHISPDSTKVEFMGAGKRQAHSWASGFSDVGGPVGSVYKITPNIGKEPSELFEMADVIAFMCAHAVHGKVKEPYFHGLLASVKHKVKSEFVVE